MKKIITSIFLLAVIISCEEKPTSSQPETLQSLPVVRVSESSANTTVQYPATIEGVTDVEIRPQVTGTLEMIYVDEGQYVEKGQTLFKINEQPYREVLNNAAANVSAAEAALIQSKLEIEKLAPLVANQVVSEYQLKSAKAAKEVAEAQLNQAKAMLGTAQINLGYTLIKAPVNGYIGRFPKKQGSIVSTTDREPLTTLSDVHDVHVYFALGEKDFFRYKEESSKADAESTPDVSLILADNQVYPEKGKIDMISGQFDDRTGTITLRATFSNAKGFLRSGNTGKIQLNILHKNVILVPQEATVEVQDRIFVFVVDKDNVVARQSIQVIGKSQNNYLVEKGLTSGSRIVLKGFDYLADGTVINPEEVKKTLAKK